MSDVAAFESTGGGARRSVVWSELDAEALGKEGRRTVGATWLGRMKQEHLAVGAFALLARELAAEGCDPIVLSLVTRASCDEVRHAELCFGLAEAYSGFFRIRSLPQAPRSLRRAIASFFLPME